MKNLQEALNDGWQVEEKLFDADKKWIGYILRKSVRSLVPPFKSQWVRALLTYK